VIVRPSMRRLRSFFKRVVVDRESGCWVWIGALREDGYGFAWTGVKPNGGIGAHRLAYIWFVGEFDRALSIDHLCRRRNCVNPVHLEPVTHAENMRRALSHRRTAKVSL
jgi:hypothetical protein